MALFPELLVILVILVNTEMKGGFDMLLGIGTAHTNADITAEYVDCYRQNCSARQYKENISRLHAPQLMQRFIDKPIADWSEADVETMFQRFQSQSHRSALEPYARFVSFLLLRGYFRPSLPSLLRMPLDASRAFAGVLESLHTRIVTTLTAEGRWAPSRHTVGHEINLLLALTAYTGQPLELVTRSQFNDFCAAYLRLRLDLLGRTSSNCVRSALTGVEVCLVRWGYLAPAQRAPSAHERRAQKIGSAAIQHALQRYVAVCTAHLQPKGVIDVGNAVAEFFIWAQEYLPLKYGRACSRLDDVTREVAVAYAPRLRARYTPHSAHTLYGTVRRFFDFAIEEMLPTAPRRNPLSRRDVPHTFEEIPRYFDDAELQRILRHCEHDAALVDRVLVITLLHTGIRASELVALRASDIVQIQGVWKLHVHVGKGLKDRVIPLTADCERALHAWCDATAISGDAPLFQHRGKPWSDDTVRLHCTNLAREVGVAHANPHRFRHTFAVALLNYGIRETALQKLLGHASLEMTLHYAKILDRTVEQAFSEAVTLMREGPMSWVPSFFTQEDYTLFAQGDTLNWIRLPVGFCRRNHKLHCESDVKCFLCERFYLTPEALPILRSMYQRFVALELPLKAAVIQAWIERLDRVAAGEEDLALPNGNPPTGPSGTSAFIPLQKVIRAPQPIERQSTAAVLAPVGGAGE